LADAKAPASRRGFFLSPACATFEQDQCRRPARGQDAPAKTRSTSMPPESIAVILAIIVIFAAFAVTLAWGSMQTRR
jgi:hypothetical protein